MDEQVKREGEGRHLRKSSGNIGASLQEKPEFEVQKIDGFLPDIIGKLDAAPPDVILFDLAAAQPHFAIPLMHTHPTILVIGVNLANSKMLVLSGRESCLITAEDLVQAIQAAALK